MEPRVEELREVIRGRIRERQKEPKMSDIEGHEIMGERGKKGNVCEDIRDKQK